MSAVDALWLLPPGAALAAGAAGVLDRLVPAGARPVYRASVVLVGIGALIALVVASLLPDLAWNVDIPLKITLAGVTIACLWLERSRARAQRPVPGKWKAAVAAGLATAAVAAYATVPWSDFDGYHLHEQFHYYLGAKYAKELGYERLYACTVVAEDDLGTQAGAGFTAGTTLDLAGEVRARSATVRDLATNSVVTTTSILEDKARCTSHFSAVRWAAFRDDVLFFRRDCTRGYWFRILGDHGFNPTPVWTILGHAFAELHPASKRTQQGLALIDVACLAGAFGMIAWGFGLRASAVAIVFWGCQAMSPFYWTGGALLRDDWLLACAVTLACLRRGHPGVAGAALAYAATLRLFPVLLFAGWAVVALLRLMRTRRLGGPDRRFAAGFAVAVVALVSLGAAVAGPQAYPEFVRHILVHEATPLTNHMGMRTLLSEDLLSWDTPASGREKFLSDRRLPDSFEPWERLRRGRDAARRPYWLGLNFAALGVLLLVMRGIEKKRPDEDVAWVGVALATALVFTALQLPCYYYVLFFLIAAMTVGAPALEPWILLYAIGSQVALLSFTHMDDAYVAMSAVTLAFLAGVVVIVARARALASSRPTPGQALPPDWG
jgi:hypothetical protein